MIKLTDRKNQVTLFSFDSMNRTVQTLHEADSSTETYNYDPAYGDLLQSQNYALSYTYSYDTKHRLLSKTDSRLGKSLNWTFDKVDNIHTKTDYQGDVTTYQYDNTNKLVAETNPAYLEVTYHYDNGSRLLDRLLSNGAHSHYVWDNANRLTLLQNTTVNGQYGNNTTYSRDAIGNILTATEAAGTKQAQGVSTYSFDPTYQLLSASYPSAVSSYNESFTYDAVGNRKTYTKGTSGNQTTYYYNRVTNSNRLKNTTLGSATGSVFESYGYDNNGNLTSISGNRTFNLSFDPRNRVSQIVKNNTSASTYSYQYDPSGYRILKNAASTSNYYLESEKLEAIYDNTGTLQAKYMRGSVIDEVVNGYQLDANNNFTNYSYHHDTLQSVLGQSSHDGNVLAAQGYTAFGSIINATGSSNNTLKYTGREQDTETGFIYYRARFNDPLLGVMLSEDPKRFGAGVNFYIYCSNNPVNCRDPSGQLADTILDAGFIAYDVYSLAKNPSWGNAAALGLDVVGAAVPFVTGLGAGYRAADNVIGTIPGINNAVPDTLARVIPGNINTTQLGITDNVFVTNPAYLNGLNPSQISNALEIPPSNSFQVITFPTSNASSIATPISSSSPGFTGGGLTSGGLPEFVIPNGPIPSSATTSFVGNRTNGFGAAYNLTSDNSASSADGGFVLYPNMSNTKQLRSVYSKP